MDTDDPRLARSPRPVHRREEGGEECHFRGEYGSVHPHASPSFPLPFLILPLFTRPRATACGAGEVDAWMPFGRFCFSPSLSPTRPEKLYGY